MELNRAFNAIAVVVVVVFVSLCVFLPLQSRAQTNGEPERFTAVAYVA
jgi:predicted secreted protein